MATKPSHLDAFKKAPVLRRLDAFKKPDSDSTSQTAPEAPQPDEATSSFSADSTKSIIKNINEDIAAIERKNEDVDLEKLMEHINQLLKLREEENQLYKKPSTVSKWTWPKSSGLKKLKDWLQSGIDVCSALVKEALLQQKMICLFGGNGYKQGTSMKEFTCFVKNALTEFSDSIHIIYIPGFDHKDLQSSKLTDVIYVSYNPLQNPDMPHGDMEDIPLLNLSEHDAIRFWTRLVSFKSLERNDNDKQWDGFKRFIHPFKCTSPWMILIDKDGEMVTKDGREIVSLYKRSMEDASKGLMQVLIMGSKEEKQQALLKFDDDDDDEEDDDDDDDEEEEEE